MPKKCKKCGTEYVYEDLTLGGITAGYPRCPNCEPLPKESSQTDIKNDIEQLLNARYDNENISAWYKVENDLVVDLMDGNTLTISFRNYPEDVEK